MARACVCYLLLVSTQNDHVVNVFECGNTTCWAAPFCHESGCGNMRKRLMNSLAQEKSPGPAHRHNSQSRCDPGIRFNSLPLNAGHANSSGLYLCQAEIRSKVDRQLHVVESVFQIPNCNCNLLPLSNLKGTQALACAQLHMSWISEVGIGPTDILNLLFFLVTKKKAICSFPGCSE